MKLDLSNMVYELTLDSAPEYDMNALYSIAVLSRVIGEQGIHDKIIKKIEKMFDKIPEIKGVKKLGDFQYLQSGILKNKSSGLDFLILSPWTSTCVKKQRKKPGHSLFTTNELLHRYYLNDIYEKYKNSYSFFTDSVSKTKDLKPVVFVIRQPIDGLCYSNSTKSLYFHEVIKSIVTYRILQNEKQEETATVLKLSITKQNYQFNLLYVATTLIHLFRVYYGYDGIKYVFKNSIAYFSADSAKKIRAEVKKKQKTFEINEVALSILKQFNSGDLTVEVFEIPELLSIYKTLEDIISSFSSVMSHKRDGLFTIPFMNDDVYFNYKTVMDEDNIELFNTLAGLLESFYRSLCKKASEDSFIHWLFYDIYHLISDNYMLYPLESTEELTEE